MAVSDSGSRKRESPRTKVHEITHLTTVHPPFDVRIFHKECKSIAQAGYHVTLIACHDRDEIKEGVRIRGLPKSRGRISRMVRGSWATYQEALRQDADLYHFHDPELLPIGLLLRMRGKTVVYDVHEDISADLANKHYIPKALGRPLAWTASKLEALCSGLLSGVVAATSTISERFSFQKQQIVVSNYPLLHEFQNIPPARAWRERSMAVAYLGVLARNRCVPELVTAMSLLPEYLQANLRLAGNFVPTSLQEELAGTPGWERTDVLGILDRLGVSRLLTEVRAGLVVLKPTPAFLESAPVKMFEYMAAGIPVIASDFPNFREIVEGSGCGILVQPDDPSEIAAAIEHLLTHPLEAEEMGNRGREAVMKKYNWASEESKLLKLYRVLLDSACVA